MGVYCKVGRLTGMEFALPCHVYGFFHNREEEYRALLLLAQEGFEKGEKGFHIMDLGHRQERCGAWSNSGSMCERRNAWVRLRSVRGRLRICERDVLTSMPCAP
jgi:hypothetical protein